MKKVTFIEKQINKKVEFTHCLGSINGWITSTPKPSYFNKVVYLGKCSIDGDMFACYSEDVNIGIYKGFLNSGNY